MVVASKKQNCLCFTSTGGVPWVERQTSVAVVKDIFPKGEFDAGSRMVGPVDWIAGIEFEGLGESDMGLLKGFVAKMLVALTPAYFHLPRHCFTLK
jgi:hypothetical protein